MENKYLKNERIKDSKILVVDENGNNLGIMSTNSARKLAKEKGLDLVLFVSGKKTGKLSICKIIDYGKFIYQLNRKQKENKKKQSIIKIKEVKVKPQTDVGDLQWKANHVNKWLQSGYQIKFKVMTFGRIATRKELIFKVYHDFLKLIEQNAKVAIELEQVSPIAYEATFVKK